MQLIGMQDSSGHFGVIQKKLSTFWTLSGHLAFDLCPSDAQQSASLQVQIGDAKGIQNMPAVIPGNEQQKMNDMIRRVFAVAEILVNAGNDEDSTPDPIDGARPVRVQTAPQKPGRRPLDGCEKPRVPLDLL